MCRNHITDGQQAEEIAAAYLQDRGVVILQRNFRVRGGEVDLIGREGATLIFVEVRLRRSADFGGARESITRRKQHRVVLAARHYLARLQGDWPCRFDCVLLEALSWQSVEWVRDAFYADHVFG